MYIRKKPNRSGSTSVVVLEKRAGKMCYLKTIGVSSAPSEIENFCEQGRKWTSVQTGERDMFLAYARHAEEKIVVEPILS